MENKLVDKYAMTALFTGAFVGDEIFHHAILGFILGGGAIINAWRAGRASRRQHT